ncbi:hypothetical protein B0H19DRAFT_1246505 [Mycena capillaripes]|nr:hypothetical protein B0H19DRAFT_1246505 [Mycena capillaripes]
MSVPLRHPWFDKPSVKRKRPVSPAESPSRAQKRRRSATLERGFAGLTLDAPMAPVPVIEEPPSPPLRPTTPDVPEITMKTSSWYEPEPDRIVITDLGAFSDEDDASPHAPGPHISPALMERLKIPLVSPLPTMPQTQALVLFRPLSSQISPHSTAHEAHAVDTRADDAMEVEP